MLTFSLGNNVCILILDPPGPLKVEIFLGGKTIQVQKPNEIFEFKRDTIASVICQVTNDEDLGNPKGMLQWFKVSSDIAFENVNVTARLSSLDFNGLKKEDNRSYICRIENEVGSQLESIQLVVLGEIFYL